MGTSEQGQRVVFVRTDRLGETLLNLPAMAAVKAALPNASLTVLVHPQLHALLEIVPWIDHVLTYLRPLNRPWWAGARRLGRQLRSQRFDIAIVSNPMKELHVAAWLAGIPQRVGYDRKWGRLLTHRLPDRKALGERHEVEYNLDLVGQLGLAVSVPPWQLPPLDREWGEVQQLLQQQGHRLATPFIAIHPWTSNPAKRWSVERFQSLIERCATEAGREVVIIGGPEEAGVPLSVRSSDRAIVNLVGRLTLRQLAAVLQRAQLLISNDSGPVHLAAAVNTRTVVLFGTSNAATGPRRWGPWGQGHVVIWRPSMDAITVEEVFHAIQRQLAV